MKILKSGIKCGVLKHKRPESHASQYGDCKQKITFSQNPPAFQNLNGIKEKNFEMMGFIRHYEEKQTLIFRQHFYPVWDGMTNGGKDNVSTSFPSVRVPDKSNSFYINPCDDMGGWWMKRG